MRYTPSIGTDLMDFIQGGPEREGMTEIPDYKLLPFEPGDNIIGKASDETLKIVLWMAAAERFSNRKTDSVNLSTSQLEKTQFGVERREIFEPLLIVLTHMFNIQTRLDARALGKDPGDYCAITVNRDLNLVGFMSSDEANRRFRMLASQTFEGLKRPPG